jgi:hypothetical protein
MSISSGDFLSDDGKAEMRAEASGAPVSDTPTFVRGNLVPFHRSASCGGETCTLCGKPADMKVGEEIMHDDPHLERHNFTAYVCLECGNRLFFPQVFRDMRAPVPPSPSGEPPVCNKPAATFRPRVGESFACVLTASHNGECAPGRTCCEHGPYIGEPGSTPRCPKCVPTPPLSEAP